MTLAFDTVTKHLCKYIFDHFSGDLTFSHIDVSNKPSIVNLVNTFSLLNTQAPTSRHVTETNVSDLVYFTTRVPDTNDTSVTQVKKFDFDNDTSENIFRISILVIWHMEDYKERNNFILRTTF